MTIEYKSPKHKIISVLRDGRDKWKEKTVTTKYELKKLKQQLKHAPSKIDQLKSELKQAKENQKKI